MLNVSDAGDRIELLRQTDNPFYNPYLYDGFNHTKWSKRDVCITDQYGEVIFEQKDVEAPDHWSLTAVTIVCQKYFRGHTETGTRETSVKQVIARVADTIAKWALDDGYLDEFNSKVFKVYLRGAMVDQKFAFNSPVFFNVGTTEKPQCSACFIQSVQDDMGSIMDLARSEVMLFRGGSGSGSNLSNIRAEGELIQGSGNASGPLSFMRGYDAFAGAIRSGGKTRRAAKLICLDADHPDIEAFVDCKALEEQKAWALIDAGYDGNFNAPGGAYDTVGYQNANHSVRVSDEFMEAVAADGEFTTFYRTTKKPAKTYKAKDLMLKMAKAAWICGDPGIQFDDTINRWHTVKDSGRINASNPCSEYMHLDDSACNLASINLGKFIDARGEFDMGAFRELCHVVILAQEVIVSRSSYPTPKIAENSENYRPLGLGFSNLGKVLMCKGLAYDSDEARDFAQEITSLMGASAYEASIVIGRVKGPFPGMKVGQNKQHIEDVMYMHYELAPANTLQDTIWYNVYKNAEFIRNAQTTVLAPTGTISFMMDCDTTGIEPEIALVKYKKLVGGGYLKLVNPSINNALTKLGYSILTSNEIMDHIERTGTIEGSPLRAEHLPIFDCAFTSSENGRAIHHMAHVKMMAACQPFLSGAISKTVNMPKDSTPEDILDVYIQAWYMGLKSIAIYRDGCKRTQPLSTTKDTGKAETPSESAPDAIQSPSDKVEALQQTERRRLPDTRQSITHKFSVGGHEGYLHVGMYEDGSPGELFIAMSKEGSTLSGLMDAFATSISMLLQHGVPLQKLADKFTGTKFEPAGWTGNTDIPLTTSLIDYVFRYLLLKFGPTNTATTIPVKSYEARVENKNVLTNASDSGKMCIECGSLMQRAGSCYTCTTCGSTTGCG